MLQYPQERQPSMYRENRPAPVAPAPEKAAMFVDNSNIFKGMISFSQHMKRKGILSPERNLKIRWDKILNLLEKQDHGLDIFARHFFASLPTSSRIHNLRQKPTEEEFDTMVRSAANEGFFRAIQQPPLNFVLHGIPLKIDEVPCSYTMKQAFYHCREAFGGQIDCGCGLDIDKCRECSHTYLRKQEEGVDTALVSQLFMTVLRSAVKIDRIILVAGDGDYVPAIRHIRADLGIDVQLMSWRYSLSSELENIVNKPVLALEDLWRDVCDTVDRPGFEAEYIGDHAEEEEEV